uniref:Matrin-type domain-containing protein n=1 Tax=Anopheles atroparvus TaxID=41427 RepID=A0AAG5CUY8_ANOAO
MESDRQNDDEVIAPGDNVAHSKLELEIENHVLSTTVKLSDGSDGPVFSRIPRNKDLLFGYSCHICGVVCLHGERMLQIHMAGRKHQARLNVAVFDAEQYRAALVVKAEKKGSATGTNAASSDNVDSAGAPDQAGNEQSSSLKAVARLQNVLDGYRDGPLVGLEYIVELSDGNSCNDPVYSCTLCSINDNNEGDITTHLINLQHRLKFLQKHYPTVQNVLAPYRHSKTERGEQVFCRVVQTVCEAIEDHHGRLTPHVYDRGDFERNRVKFIQEIAFGSHFDERTGKKFVEVIDHKVLEDLAGAEDRSDQGQGQGQGQGKGQEKEKEKGKGKGKGQGSGQPKRYRNRNERGSLDSISSISSANSVLSISSSGDNKEPERGRKRSPLNGRRPVADEPYVISGNRVDYRQGEGYNDRGRSGLASCIDTSRNTQILPTPRELSLQSAAIAHERYKWEKYRCSLELAVTQLTKKLKEYEKSPEKHPLYSEEWKKFWNRRYKELQLEKKDPQKHNFKPEWIEFWTKRMQELHEEEVERKKLEIRAKLQLPAEGEERTEELREQYAVRVPPNSVKRSRSIEHKNDAPPTTTVLIDVNSDEEEDDYYKGGQPMPGRGRGGRTARRTADWERSRHRSASRSHRSRSPISDDAMDGFSRVPSSSRYHGPPMDREPRPSRSSEGRAPPEQVDYDSWARNYYGPNKKVFVRTEFDSDNVPLNFIAVCRLLTAFEEYLGSLGPKVIDLMAKALALEKVKANSADDLLLNEDNCMLLETVKEKLKGHMMAETIDPPKMAPIKKAVRNIARLLHEASKLEPVNKPAEEELSRDSLSFSEVNTPVAPMAPSVSGLDKIAIAEQLAKALVAQGKVDFTTEELEQLINVYIAMEKMSRERNTTISTKIYLAALPPTAVAATASAAAVTAVAPAPVEPKEVPPKGLDRARMELPGHRRPEKNDFRLASGGTGSGPKGRELTNPPAIASSSSSSGMLENLSDSDLQTLLQSFKELSSEEQMHLISYLRKLERTEPERVDRLRRYVDFDSLNGRSGREYGRDQSEDDSRDYGDNDDDRDFETTFRASSGASNAGRNQQQKAVSINHQQKFVQNQQHQQQQQQQQQQQPQQQQKPQQQKPQQQQMANRQKEQQQQKGGNKLIVDSEDEDDYSYDDILRAASKNVSSVTHQSKSSVDLHDTSSNQSHRGNANEPAGSSTTATSLHDTQNLIANLMESLQKSVSDANSSTTGGPRAGGSRESGMDYTNPITTIGTLAGVGRSAASNASATGSGAASYYPAQASQLQPRAQAPQALQQASSTMALQPLGLYGAPQGPPLGQQPMMQSQGSTMGQSQGMGQMQQQQSFGQPFMYQAQMFGTNGQSQSQQQYSNYGNFGYY